MWFKLNLEGLVFNFKVENYKQNQDIDYEWTDVSFNFKFQNIINYSINKSELLESSEIDHLVNILEDLLNNKLNSIINFECIEPDFTFIFNPDSSDGMMELKVNLWNEGLTYNYFSTTFGRKEVEQLYLYLCLITNKLNYNDNKIKQLIDDGVIYSEFKNDILDGLEKEYGTNDMSWTEAESLLQNVRRERLNNLYPKDNIKE